LVFTATNHVSYIMDQLDGGCIPQSLWISHFPEQRRTLACMQSCDLTNALSWSGPRPTFHVITIDIIGTIIVYYYYYYYYI